MNSRKQILDKIRSNKPPGKLLSTFPNFTNAIDRLDDIFIVQAQLSGSHCYRLVERSQIEYFIRERFPKAKEIVSLCQAMSGTFDQSRLTSPRDLQVIDLAILETKIGVAENGAIWIDDDASSVRVLPFITQHLVVVLNPANIIENMTVAYKKLKIDATGFGVWIAGPSKTADIEQTLVSPLRKGCQIKIGSFGDLSIFLNRLILRHHPISKKCKSHPKPTHFMKMAIFRVGSLVVGAQGARSLSILIVP